MPQNEKEDIDRTNCFKRLTIEDILQEQKNDRRFEPCYYFNDPKFENIPFNEIINNENEKCFEKCKQDPREEYNSYRLQAQKEDSDQYNIKTRTRSRARTSQSQLEILESICKTTLKPNKELRMQLAHELKITERQVQIWFQNKRAKSKKQMEKSMYHQQSMMKSFNNASYMPKYTELHPIEAEEHYQIQENPYIPPNDLYFNTQGANHPMYANKYNNSYTINYNKDVANRQHHPDVQMKHYNYLNYESMMGKDNTEQQGGHHNENLYYSANNRDDNASYYYDRVEMNKQNFGNE